jgi:hypothetical protein
MAYRSPQETLQALVGAVTKVFLPMRPLMQQAGVSINIKRFAELFAELSDMPEMGELIETAGPADGGCRGRRIRRRGRRLRDADLRAGQPQ